MSKVFNKPIVLVGMMGSGKSHVGRILASRLGLRFFDADKVIEDREGRSVNEIFSSVGECGFRDVEAEVIGGLLGGDCCVISTGGGAVTTPKVLEDIQGRAVVVWLQTSVDKILPRVIHDKNRPLLQCDDPKAKLEALMAEREPLYARADIHILNEDCSVEGSVEKILQALNKFM